MKNKDSKQAHGNGDLDKTFETYAHSCLCMNLSIYYNAYQYWSVKLYLMSYSIVWHRIAHQDSLSVDSNFVYFIMQTPVNRV